MQAQDFLLEASDSRSFLKIALELQSSGAKVNLADFSRRAGFTSRSYLAEYLNAKKGLSLESFKKIKNNLKLSSEYLRLFELLVLIDFPKLRKKNQTTEELIVLVRNIKEQLSHFKNQNLPPIKNCFLVYAALGEIENKRSKKEICEITKLDIKEVEDALDVLLAEKLIHKKGQIYSITLARLDFFNVKDERLNLLMKEVLKDASYKMQEIIDSDKNLMTYTCFSINADNEYVFKRRLREAMMSVVDEFQDDNSKTIKQVLTIAY